MAVIRRPPSNGHVASDSVFRFSDRVFWGHNAPLPGALWQVPARLPSRRRVGALTVRLVTVGIN